MAREAALYDSKSLEVARVLDNSLLAEYIDSVKSSYNSKKARQVLGKFSTGEGETIGSSPFMLVHLQNSGLLSGRRIATRQDLETALRSRPDFLSENSADCGLSLITAGDSYLPNDLLAKNLSEQLKQRAIKLRKGKLIPISALRLREDSNSAYGLVFDLNEDVKKLEDLSQFEWNCQRNEGLSRAGLSRFRYWNSFVGNLGDSVASGRVVVISGEA